MSEETLFHEALAKPPAERVAFLDQACAEQPKLRSAVLALLAVNQRSGHMLDRRPVAPKSATVWAEAGQRAINSCANHCQLWETLAA